MAEHVYDSSDSCTGKSAVQEPLEYSIYGLLKKYQITITTAESATGGMIASTLINVPGISEFFTEGYVTYSNEAKVKMIHVAPETIDTYGVVSSETAADMAASGSKNGCNNGGSIRDRCCRTRWGNERMPGRAGVYRLLSEWKDSDGVSYVFRQPHGCKKERHRKRTFPVKKMYRRNVCSVKNPYRKDILH